MSTLFDLSPVTVAVKDSPQRYPVRRLYCVGRNYAEHAREMGQDPEREAPFFFTKWPDTVMPSGSVVPYPPETANFHYEGELVVAIGAPGRNLNAQKAREVVFGFACGLDMTRRDLQLAARDKGRPWDAGKNFDHAAPLGLLHPLTETGWLEKGAITLAVNGTVKQKADLADLIWSVEEIIAILSRSYHLQPGDLIYTGTPAGVGPVKPGDAIKVSIAGLSDLDVTIGEPAA